jgi:hypothetical protein
MSNTTYKIKPENGVPINAWTKGVPLEDAARQQLLNVAQLPFIYKWVAAMPDVHWGILSLLDNTFVHNLFGNCSNLRLSLVSPLVT